MSHIKYEIPKEKIDTGEILDLVFKDSFVNGINDFKILTNPPVLNNSSLNYISIVKILFNIFHKLNNFITPNCTFN